MRREGSGVAGLSGGFWACQGDSSDLSQLLLPDKRGTPLDTTSVTTHEVLPVQRERQERGRRGRRKASR